VLEVMTRNTTYTLITRTPTEALIWGHEEYCPVPTCFEGIGSTNPHGVYRPGYLCPGTRLTIPVAGRHVVTSNIARIQLKPRQ